MKQIVVRKSQNNVRIILLLLILFVFTGSQAQFNNGSQITFGKNRVQYSERLWYYFRFTNFDTYYYAGGKELAIYASTFANKELETISQKLDYTVEEKIKFIIFNDLSDLKETNIGLITNQEYNTGGITHIIDNKVFIYFNGNHKDFETQIKQGIADVIIQQMMYGGSNSSKVKNSILLSFPQWYTDGLKSYLAENWNTKIDNVVRHAIMDDKFDNFYKLTPEEQIYAGHSIWKYIDEKYGPKAIGEILYMSKVNRNIESGFLFILGLNYTMFMEDWRNYYYQKYLRESELEYDTESQALLKKPKKNVIYSNVKISSDAKYLAYCTNEYGKVKVYLKDLSTGKTKRLMKFGEKLNEKVDYSYPILAWAPQGNYLTIVREKKDKNILLIYNVEEKSWRKRFLMNFDRVLSMSYNNAGNTLVMSVVKDGQSDIYLYSLGANSYTQITKDIFDDEYPRFINNSTAIIFSSNRVHDTIRFDIETAKNFIRDTIKGQQNKDLFMYNLAQQSRILHRITKTSLADETHPVPISYNTFMFLSDENGTNNRYYGKFDSTIAYIDTTTHYRYFTNYFPLTNSNFSIHELDVNQGTSLFVETKTIKDRNYVYVNKLEIEKESSVSKLLLTDYMQRLVFQENQARVKQVKPNNNDTLQNPNLEENKKKFKVIYVENESNTKSGGIDINNYTFTDRIDSLKRANAQVQQKTNEEQFKLFSQRNYEVQFSVNEVVSQIDFNYLNYSYQPFTNSKTPIYLNSGFNVFMKLGVEDLFEDYRIIGGVRLVNVFKDNEYFISYADLKHRLDKEYVFHRKILETGIEGEYIAKHYIHDGVVNLNWAFNNTKSLRSTFIYTNDLAVNLATDRNNLIKKNTSSNKVGMRLEFVSDNTRQASFNIMFGTRYKLFAEYYQPVEDYKKNLIVLGLDFRKYTKIHKNFIWANRVAASTSLGNERLIYYLGGVDNALIPKFNKNIQVSQSQNYAYQTLATNMRGFDQNIRNGNNFIVLNSELRLPFFQYLSKKPVKNQFLNNFMVIGFFDMGTAWTGTNPFSDSNSLYVQIQEQTPITVTIINQNDPVVYGYGFGFRSKILGYYTRLDWAWGVQNGYIGKRRIHLSFSLDF